MTGSPAGLLLIPAEYTILTYITPHLLLRMMVCPRPLIGGATTPPPASRNTVNYSIWSYCSVSALSLLQDTSLHLPCHLTSSSGKRHTLNRLSATKLLPTHHNEHRSHPMSPYQPSPVVIGSGQINPGGPTSTTHHVNQFPTKVQSSSLDLTSDRTNSSPISVRNPDTEPGHIPEEN